MKQRYVNTKFWCDNYIMNLDPIEKLLFIYLLTNDKTNILGIYELNIKLMSLEAGIEKEMLLKIIGRFEKDDKIYYVDGWIFIKNFAKHQNINSPKIKKGIENELKLIEIGILEAFSKKCDIKGVFDTLSIPYPYPIDTPSHLIKLNSIKYNSIKLNKIDLSLSKKLSDYIIQNNPLYQKKEFKYNKEKWANDFRLMRERDNLSEKQLEFIIDWSQNNEFWKTNILSPSKLRKQMTKLVIQAKQDYNKNSNIIAKV